MLLRNLAQSDCNIAREPRFRREQIVTGRIEPMLANVVADGKQFARLIVQ
jgi:hypothetical protein